MAIEYLGLSNINGPLVILEGVQDAFYDEIVEFIVEGDEDSQITVGLKDDTEYEVFIDGKNVGTMKTGLGGKLSLSVELEAAGEVPVKIVEA